MLGLDLACVIDFRLANIFPSCQKYSHLLQNMARLRVKTVPIERCQKTTHPSIHCSLSDSSANHRDGTLSCKLILNIIWSNLFVLNIKIILHVHVFGNILSLTNLAPIKNRQILPHYLRSPFLAPLDMTNTVDQTMQLSLDVGFQLDLEKRKKV